VTAVPVRAAVPAHRPVPAIRPVLAVTSAAGRYTIGGVAPRRYRVEFASGCGATGYATQWWQGANSVAMATIITIAAGTTTTGISAACVLSLMFQSCMALITGRALASRQKRALTGRLQPAPGSDRFSMVHVASDFLAYDR
jgi:hypothetical protein